MPERSRSKTWPRKMRQTRITGCLPPPTMWQTRVLDANSGRSISRRTVGNRLRLAAATTRRPAARHGNRRTAAGRREKRHRPNARTLGGTIGVTLAHTALKRWATSLSAWKSRRNRSQISANAPANALPAGLQKAKPMTQRTKLQTDDANASDNRPRQPRPLNVTPKPNIQKSTS